MPITFKKDEKNRYSIYIFTGVITDEVLLAGFKSIFANENWVPEMNELVDLSEADVSQVTDEGILELAALGKEIYEKHGVTKIKSAVYAPTDLSFGLTRMYEALKHDSPEDLNVFRDLDEAIRWLSDE